MRSSHKLHWWHYITLCVAVFAFAGAADNTLLREGLEAFRRRDFAAAERAFSVLARQNPNAHSWKLLGMTYIAQEKYNQAEEPCRRACRLDPREENACYYLGRVYYT